jgi:hypothetical protein
MCPFGVGCAFRFLCFVRSSEFVPHRCSEIPKYPYKLNRFRASFSLSSPAGDLVWPPDFFGPARMVGRLAVRVSCGEV